MPLLIFVMLVASAAAAHGQAAPLASLVDSVEAGEATWDPATRARLLQLASGAPRPLRQRAWSVAIAQDSGRAEQASTFERGLRENAVSVRLAEKTLRDVLRAEGQGDSVERFVTQLELLHPASDPSAPLAVRAARLQEALATLDPAPATSVNERLVIHVARLGHALRMYSDDESPTGLDARGDTFLRYGEPDRMRSVTFNDGEILRVARNRGIHVSRADYPENEVWIYDRLSNQGIFIFVQGRDKRYALGDTNELIPRGLRSRGGNRGPRAAGYTEVGLMTMRHVLGQLALFHPSYSSRYAEVQNYVSYIEESARSGRRNPSGVSRMPDLVTFDRDGSRGFIESLASNAVSDEGIAAARQETMPTQASLAVSKPLDVRLVRFLDGDRTVRELLWSSQAGDRSTVWQVAPTHSAIADTLASGLVRLDVYVEPGGQVGVQIDRVVGDAEAGIWRPEAAGYASVRPNLDTGATIELSDPLPFESGNVTVDGDSLRARIGRGEIQPLIAPSLEGREGAGVYLEAYLANPRGSMQVRYKIVTRRRGRLFRPSSATEEEFVFVRLVNGKVTPIAFLVDRANWEGADEVDFEIEVEYLPTGDTARRVVSFAVN